MMLRENPYTDTVNVSATGQLTLPLCLTVLSAALSGASIILPHAWALVFIGPALFLYVLFSHLTTSRMKALLYGLTFGLVFNGIIGATISWPVYPLDWIGIGNPAVGFLLIGIVWLLYAVFLSVSAVFFSISIFELKYRRMFAFLLPPAAVGLWTIVEQARPLLFSILFLGPTSTINSFFDIGSLGYAFGNAGNEFWIALARWGGVPLLSVFPVFFGAYSALVLSSYKEGRTLYTAATVLTLIVFLFGNALASSAAERARGIADSWEDANALIVAALRSDFPASLIPDRNEMKKRTDFLFETTTALQELHIEPDVVLLPEGTGLSLDTSGYAKVSAALPEDTLVLHSKYVQEEPGRAKVPQIWSRVIGGGTYVTDKQFIVPFGEYPPYLFSLPLKYLNRSLYENIMENRGYVGGQSASLGKARGVAVGARACSEAFSSSLYRELAEEQDAGLLTHMSSDRKSVV